MRAESATWGSALIAGKACGVITDLAKAALTGSPVQESCHQPDPSLRKTYDRAISRYLAWQRVLEKGFKQYA
jgi:ribulose kinase